MLYILLNLFYLSRLLLLVELFLARIYDPGTLVSQEIAFVYSTLRFSLLLYSNIKVHHDGAAMTPSAVDAILILTRMPEYYLTPPLLLPMQLNHRATASVDRAISRT